MYKKPSEFAANLGGGKIVLDEKKNKAAFVWTSGTTVTEYV